ncbi:SMI1/KNR4 family protein [Streptomyces sp. NBC_01304]|uniref:SMI1/KNR4 family protein n=1 Tax=Streptomyces sp. NBC_01304 TaxID=2903818 RepID=UPI002E15C4A0|nr:SMI1/KNR4 family protein [Streptomyces sp. NBC_01304]
MLRPPAGEAGIAAAEAALGVELPAALAASYRGHDGFDEGHGSGILSSDMMMLPLEQLVEEYRTQTQEWGREAGVLPFARKAGDIWSGWYGDVRKGEPSYGGLGRWSVDGGSEPYWAGSQCWTLTDWLGEIAAALEEGRCLRRPDGADDRYNWPVLTGLRGLTWVDPRVRGCSPKG